MWVKLIKTVIILALIAIIGFVGFCAYWFFILDPKEQSAREMQNLNAAGFASTPDPSTPLFEKARDLKSEGKYSEAINTLENLLGRYPATSHLPEVEQLLGEVNVEQLFSDSPTADKTVYLVKSGDTINKIASQNQVPAELIYRASGLDSTRLQIEQRLQIPHIEPAIEIHLKSKKVYVLNHGRFFRSYPIQVLHLPPNALAKKEIKTKVTAKAAYNNGKQIGFTAPNFNRSARVINLQQIGYALYGEPDKVNSDGSPADGFSDAVTEMPPIKGGIGLKPSDIEELYALVDSGCPVVIQSE